MNLSSIKRKLLGHTLMGSEDGSGGESSSLGNQSAAFGGSDGFGGHSAPSSLGGTGGWSSSGGGYSLGGTRAQIGGEGLSATTNTSSDAGASLSMSDPSRLGGDEGSGGSGHGLSVGAIDSRQVSLDGLDARGFTQQQIDGWADMSPEYQQKFNAAHDLPATPAYTYNLADRGWKESITDATTPSEGSLLSRLGWRGAGVDANSYLSNETADRRADRMGLISNGINRLGMTALNAVPGAGMALTAANAVDAVQNRNMSVADAFKNAAFDIGGKFFTAPINRAVAGALGADGRALTNQYNNVAAFANVVAPGSLPAFNLGALALKQTKDWAGYTGLGAPSNMTMPGTGEPTVTAGPMAQQSGSGHQAGGPAEPAAPEQQAPKIAVAQEAPTYATDMRFNLDGTGAGRAMRSTLKRGW